jgi:hypothetical protein
LSSYHATHGLQDGAVLSGHCSCMSARLAGINDAACSYVLQAHDGSDVRHLENMRASLIAQVGQLGFSICLRPATHTELQNAWQCRSPLGWEAGFKVVGHAVASEPSLAGGEV